MHKVVGHGMLGGYATSQGALVVYGVWMVAQRAERERMVLFGTVISMCTSLQGSGMRLDPLRTWKQLYDKFTEML